MTTPHATREGWLAGATEAPRTKKQTTRMLKVSCRRVGCGYMVRMTRKWADIALPQCPVTTGHGKMVCAAIDDDGKGEG